MKKLSIIIPVYNERNTVLQVLKRVQAQPIGKLKKEIILVDDGSTDGTREVLKKAKGCKIILHVKNRGKGSALRTGFKEATGDLLMVQDADLEYNPKEYPRLLAPLLAGKTEVVFGSRFMGKHSPGYWVYYLGNQVLSGLTTFLYGQRITDMETCYKLFTRNAYEKICLKAKRFDIEPELTAKFILAGFNITEIPIAYKGRHFDEGKKITWWDGIQAAGHLLRFRLGL